jgi:AraC family transcriptional regulator
MPIAFGLYETPELFFAELWCPPDDPAWQEDNQVTHPIIALPATPVWQVHDGAERQLFNQNNVVFHLAGSEYRRERFRDVGYRCLFFFPSTSLFGEVITEIDPDRDERSIRGLRAGAALDARTFALSRLAARYLRTPQADPEAAREILYEVLRGAVRSADPGPRQQGTRSRTTQRAQREIVEEAKEILTARMAQRLSLDEIARAVHSSPYHLARLFRAATGFSVHGYLTHLRLRTGLEWIQGTSEEIGEVGVRLGFSSHSHFTAAFRRAFGLAPSRAGLRPRSGRGESSTFLTAGPILTP